LNLSSLISYLKPIILWSFIFFVLAEVLLHFKLNDLPYKFLNHTTGIVHKLGQYSKEKVLPNDYIAIVGDSNVYGFGPLLYDNSWSMEQPSFAPHHFLHSSLDRDVLSFGYPGFGSFGASLTMVHELKTIQKSWLWPKIEDPNEILFVFYEGNDLINNLHELEQRGVSMQKPISGEPHIPFEKIFQIEEVRLESTISWSDQLASWNLTSGIFKNYLNKLNADDTSRIDNPSNETAQETNSKDTFSATSKTNIAMIEGEEVRLGFCEDPALLLSQEEISFALKITESSLSYLIDEFPNTNIHFVYLPSSLSVYNLSDFNVSAAPFNLAGHPRSGSFTPSEVADKNQFLRKHCKDMCINLGISFLDCTERLAKDAKSTLLHGPRDPIHLNKAGYESFANAILYHLNSKS
jgi:hypothetical protein